MEGVVALHQVIDEEGIHFPVPRLYDHAPSFEEPGHLILDSITGEIITHEDKIHIDKKSSEIIDLRRRRTLNMNDGENLLSSGTNVPSPGNLGMNTRRSRANTPTYVEMPDGSISIARDNSKASINSGRSN